MSGARRPARGGETPYFRTTVAASLLLHAALFLVPAALWQQLSGLGPRGGIGPGGGRPLVVSFYDPGPPGEEPVADPEPELEPSPPEAEPIAPQAPLPSPQAPPPSSPPAPAAAPGEGTTGEGPLGDRIPGAPGSGEVPGLEADGNVRFHPPRLLTGALPIDPEEIEDLDVPGEIPVRIRVGRDGRVLRIEPLQTGLPDVVREAIERSARAMRFVPARQGKEAVEAWFPMTFIYDPGS